MAGNASLPLSSTPIAMISISNSVIAGGRFNQYNQHQHTENAGQECLMKAVAPGAFHDSGERFDPPKCHPNTRVAVMSRIMDWILGQSPETKSYLMMWLNGAAGAGKSAIAQSIAARCCKEKYLVGSFFFRRTDPNRNHAKSLFPTIAYQMALALPQTHEDVLGAIVHDPLIFTRSLAAQFFALLVRPLQKLAATGFFIQNPICPCLVIIDGLDECVDRLVQVEILDIIARGIQANQIPLIFLIASRPEPDITHAIRNPDRRKLVTHLVLDDKYQPDVDIEIFLRDKFHEIKTTHPAKHAISSTWPTDEVIENLVNKSSGQFIYPSAVMRYVSCIRHQPEHRLEVVLNLRPIVGHHPFAELDALYMHIFSCVEDIELVLLILAFHLLAPSKYGAPAYSSVLGMDPAAVELLFCDLASIIALETKLDDVAHITFLHASIPDFLSDKGRSHGYHIGEEHAVAAIIRKSIEYLTCQRFPIQVNDFDHSLDCALNALQTYSDNSIIWDEMQNDIYSISLPTWNRWPGLMDISDEKKLTLISEINFHVIPQFFSVLESLKYKGRNVDGLQMHHLSSIFHVLKQHLACYLQDKHLTLVLGIIDFIHSNGDTRKAARSMLEPDSLLFDGPVLVENGLLTPGFALMEFCRYHWRKLPAGILQI